MSITYARFPNPIIASQASQQLRQRMAGSGTVEMLRSARRLSHHIIPLRMTAARVGGALGGVTVALLSVLAVSAGLWTMASAGRPVPAVGETLALCVGLSALLGGLAGALAFASDSTANIQRLRGWLRSGKPVVIVESRRGHEQTLRMLGADAVGKIG